MNGSFFFFSLRQNFFACLQSWQGSVWMKPVFFFFFLKHFCKPAIIKKYCQFFFLRFWWLLLKKKWWQISSNLQHLPRLSSNSMVWINPPKIFSYSIFTQFCLGQFTVQWLLFTTCSEVNPLIWQDHFSLGLWGNQSGSWSLNVFLFS